LTPPVTAIAREHFEWVLAGVCQLFRVPFDPALAKQQFPPPYSIDVLISAAGYSRSSCI
jgi:subfamily B ATP-binding cassette protein HlyB/CyaB